MQVYKAWGSTFGACEAPLVGPAEMVVAPVSVVLQRRVRERRHRPVKEPAPVRPAPCPPRREPRTVAAAPEEEMSAWLRRAVALGLVGRELGSEGTAALFAGRMDGSIAKGLAELRDSGQLGSAIERALAEQRLSARPDVPLERIVRSALRRYDLRDWLPQHGMSLR
jgi:hypothetical protein